MFYEAGIIASEAAVYVVIFIDADCAAETDCSTRNQYANSMGDDLLCEIIRLRMTGTLR